MRPHEKRNQNGFDSIFLKKEREEEVGGVQFWEDYAEI